VTKVYGPRSPPTNEDPASSSATPTGAKADQAGGEQFAGPDTGSRQAQQLSAFPQLSDELAYRKLARITLDRTERLYPPEPRARGPQTGRPYLPITIALLVALVLIGAFIWMRWAA